MHPAESCPSPGGRAETPGLEERGDVRAESRARPQSARGRGPPGDRGLPEPDRGRGRQMEVRGGPEEGPEGAAAEIQRRARQGPAESRSEGRRGAMHGEPGPGFRASPSSLIRAARQDLRGAEAGCLLGEKSPDRSSLPVCRGGPGLVFGAAETGGWRMRASRLIPSIASDPGDQLAGPPTPLTPCAPARALRCVLLQPSQAPTAHASRLPLGSASGEGLAGAQGAGPVPHQHHLGSRAGRTAPPDSAAPGHCTRPSSCPGPVSHLRLLHAPPKLRLHSPPVSPREPGIRKRRSTTPTTPSLGGSPPGPTPRGVLSDPCTAPPLISLVYMRVPPSTPGAFPDHTTDPGPSPSPFCL